MISMQGNSEADRGAGARADARTVLVILGALAAASAAACGDDGTGIGATTVLPTGTSNLTTAADDDDDDDFPDDDDDDNDDDDDDNDDDDDDESTGGGADGTDSSGGSSSTGCEVGTEGCDCSEDDPPCEDGLECIADLCSAALCPDDDEDPSNDIPQDAIDQGDFDDGGNGDTITSQLAGTEDVDWFSWTCNDTLIPELDPSVQITNNDPLRVCLFLDCAVGGNPTQFSCGGNATEESINFEFLDGCCVSDGSSFDIDYNCPDSDNDSVIGYLRVDTAQEEICIDYQVDFSC